MTPDIRVLDVKAANEALLSHAKEQGLYICEQERWSKKACEAACKRRNSDGYGSMHPYHGLIHSAELGKIVPEPS